MTYFGIALIILGTVLAILVASPGQHRIEWKAVWTVLLALLAISVSYSLQSYILRFINVDTFFAVARISQLFFGLALLFLVSIRNEFTSIVTRLSPLTLLITVAIGMFNLFPL